MDDYNSLKIWYAVFMLVVLIILSVGLLGVIIYFAISSKSSKPLRLAAVLALALICLSLGVSCFFLIRGPVEDPSAIPIAVLLEGTKPAKKESNIMNIVSMALVLVFLGLVITKAMRDQAKIDKLAVKTVQPKAFPKNDDLDVSMGDEDINIDDDNFDFDNN